MASRAPKKYADEERTEVTEAWRTWKEDRDLLQAETFFNQPGTDHSQYFPEAHDKVLPEEGGWVIVIDPPVTEQWSRFKVPLLSIWFARPNLLNSGKIAGRHPYQAVITTPGGDLHLWPREYVLCSDVKNFLGLEGVEFVSLGGEPVLDEDHMFYLQSRGITSEEAAQLLFDQIKQPNYCYFTMPDYAKDFFAGVGTMPTRERSVRTEYQEGKIA